MNAAEQLRQYLSHDPEGRQVILIPEGRYSGWLPSCLYDMPCREVCLPFLKLLSFPVGGSSPGQLMDMENFIAVGNYLTHLPESFARCQNLVQLNLSFNHFERIPSPIFRLVNLVELDFSENDLKEVNPKIGELEKLRSLNLSGNLLADGDLPKELAKCKRLERLDLSRKWYPKGGFTVLPEAVCDLQELSFLDVSWHKIHTIPDNVRNMSKLHTVRMKGNFLKHVSPAMGECKRLQHLDLSGAMKLSSTIPEAILTLSDLRILDLTNNYFTEMPPEIVGLKKLKKLILRRNAMLRLQDELFQLEALESLDVSENYIMLVPPSISQLSSLKYLYLGCNKIQSLPVEICDCESLIELQLHLNEITSLPEPLYKLSNLEELQLEGNQLKQLPLMLDKLEKLETTQRLSLYNNHMMRPPQAVCDQGVAAVFAYLKELRICEAMHHRKLILIGASRAGKTSLRNALVLGKSKLTEDHERTWVMERHLWEPESDVRGQILDLGGHHIYSTAHHMFLTPEALHILVFDLTLYSCTAEDYNKLIGDWIEAIQDRALGSAIMVLGTHADLCDEEGIKLRTKDVLRRMLEEENNKISVLRAALSIEQDKQSKAVKESGQKFPDLATQRMQDRISHMKKLLSTRVQLPTEIYAVSCAEELSGVPEFSDMLISKLRDSEEMPLPRSWFKFLSRIQERQEKILSWHETLKIFKDVMETVQQSMIMLQGTAETSLEMVLHYLHVTGEIVWYRDNPKLREIVFHRPETLIEMLRAIFRHDFKEVVNYVESYGLKTGLSSERFETLKEAFLQRGLMTLELLDYTLLHFSLLVDARDIFIDLMLKFYLCYEVQKTTSVPEMMGVDRILQFPWFLTSSPPDDFQSKWPEKAPVNKIEMRFQLQFVKKGPANFFEKLSARLQSYVTYRQDWLDGILAYRNKSKMLVCRSKNGGNTLVSLAVRGDDLQELWFLILSCRADMTVLLTEWPFVRVEANVVCAHCIVTGAETPYLWRGEVLDVKCPKGIYYTSCPTTGPDIAIPACLIYPIDPEFHAEDLGRHLVVVTEFLNSVYDTVDSAGLLSDLLLANIAGQLGAEWHMVALNLGLTQATIEQIQLDNPGFTHRQIQTALKRWRDGSALSQDEKVTSLLRAIEDSNRSDLADDLRRQYCPDSPDAAFDLQVQQSENKGVEEQLGVEEAEPEGRILNTSELEAVGPGYDTPSTPIASHEADSPDGALDLQVQQSENKDIEGGILVFATRSNNEPVSSTDDDRGVLIQSLEKKGTMTKLEHGVFGRWYLDRDGTLSVFRVNK